jgi:hypothetical protein
MMGKAPWVVACLPFMALVAFVLRYGITLPYWDQWELVPYLGRMAAGTLTFEDLMAQHNAHRILFPRIIMVTMAQISDWNIAWELAVNVVLGMGIFCTLHALTRRIARLGLMSGPAPWLTPALAIAVFSMAQWRNWLWGWQLQIFLCIFAALLSLTLLCRPGGGWKGHLAAIASAFVATFSFAAGLAVWPAGLVGFLIVGKARMPQRNLKMAFWILFGILAFQYYLLDFEQPGDATSVSLSISGLITFAAYYLAFIGGGAHSTYGPLAVAVGLAGLTFAVAWSLVCLRQRGASGDYVAPIVAIVLFIMGSAAIAAMGRAGEGVAQAISSRYTTFTSPFWYLVIVMVMLGIPQFRGKDRNIPIQNHGWLRTRTALAILLTAVLAINSLQGALAGSQRGRHVEGARSALIENGDEATLKRLYPVVDTLRARRETLRRLGVTVFRL